MFQRYFIGKERFEKNFGVHVIETPNALKGSEYSYEHPEKRLFYSTCTSGSLEKTTCVQ